MPTLPRLRAGLDIIPSPDGDRPGFAVRDPYRYTDTVLFIPAVWAAALACLDGGHTELDVQEVMTRQLGRLVFSSDVRAMVDTLQAHGFLETEEYAQRREQKHAGFRAAASREAVHPGTAYPATEAEARRFFAGFLEPASPEGLAPGALGIAAPHVSIEGGRACYSAAYSPLARHPELAGRTIVVLGTSHYGQPETFGLTRKPFVTPLGRLAVDTRLVDWLEAHGGSAVTTEDYCHAIEHSIEFQCLFLQQSLGNEARILPVLCGSFTQALRSGRFPESQSELARFFEALQEMAEREGNNLFWVLGIDLAHVGRRYGDPFAAVAGQGRLLKVADEDRRRIALVCDGDAAGFFELVAADEDELNWCGFSALYAFLKALPGARGRLLRYEQWNIDPQSVVTFASLQLSAET
jgi:hypothetical protein